MAAKYVVKLLSPEGQVVEEEIEVEDESEILRIFNQRGFIVLEYKVDRLYELRKFLQNISPFKRISRQELADFCYFVGRAIDVGIPLLEVLEDIKSSTRNKCFQRIIEEIIENIRAGETISKAMARTKAFPGELVGLVKIGEETDALPKIFLNYAEYLDWRIKIEKEVKKALMYPAFVALVLVLTIVVMFGFIIPQILPVIRALGLKEYPLPTKILLTSGFILQHFWLQIILGTVIVTLNSFILVHKSRKVKKFWHKLKLKLPLLGEIFLKSCLSKDIRAIAEVFRSGGTILYAVELIIDYVEQNTIIKEIFFKVRENLLNGDMLSSAMEKTGFFEPSIIRMIKLGEDTGALDVALIRLAELYEDDMRRKIESLTIVIEPTLQLILGGILGIIALGILLPVYNVLTQIR